MVRPDETGAWTRWLTNFDATNVYAANDECVYPDSGYDCDGNCLMDTDMDGVCDEFEVAGCTDEEARNYNAEATDDDGNASLQTRPVKNAQKTGRLC